MCECGAYKTFGAAKGEVGHSNWCVWSPNYQPPPQPQLDLAICITCDSYVSGVACGKYATTWIQFAAFSTKWYYCDDCFKSTSASSVVHTYGRIVP